MAWWCLWWWMEWCLFSTKRDAYGDIYGLPFSLYGICIASYSLHWHMELCYESMVSIVSVQHRLLGITMQLHTFGVWRHETWHSHSICIMILDYGIYVLDSGFWRDTEEQCFSKACWWLVFILHMKYLFGLLYLMDYHWFTLEELHLHYDFGIWNVCLELWLGR